MNEPADSPPAVICTNDRYVRLYANLDSSIPRSIKYAGLIVGGKVLGWMPHLAISEDAGTGMFTFYACDEEWHPVGIAGAKTIEELKRLAEKLFPGVSARWIEANFTDEDAEKSREAGLGAYRCFACGRRPDQAGDDVEFKEQVGGGYQCSDCERTFNVER